MNEPQQQTNQDQVALWNTSAGDAWVAMQSVLDRMLAPVAVRLLNAGFPGAGRRVLDIGCGAGSTTLAMAERLGPQGRCRGVDISEPLLAAARARAAAEGIANADFVQADAQVYAFEPESADAIISRFGVMFFENPVAAFGNLKRACKPDAPLTFAAWRSPAENPFLSLARRVAEPLLPNLPTPAADAPGQFAFADATRVQGILESSGWAHIRIQPLDEEGYIAAPDLPRYLTKVGPVSLALRDADATTRARVADVLREAYAPLVREGAARFTMACWLVEARAA